MRSCKIAAKRDAREFIVVVVIETTQFGNAGTDGHFIGCPRGVFAGASTVVEVVDVAHNGHPRKGGEAQGKEARQVAVLKVGCLVRRGIIEGVMFEKLFVVDVEI